jgi:DNA/RNA-binding domain of Phe-tRNA-synthetase-like protein
MRYELESRVFELFPRFRRGVIVASDVDNGSPNATVERLLSDAISGVPPAPTSIEEQRVNAWNAAYERLGIDPRKVTPSMSFLLSQVRRGRPPRSINTLVNLFNAVSLKRIIPCGGDDLNAIEGGDLRLGFATGKETFAPLFKPDAAESPLPGELIYFTPQTGRVLCRRWTWRNSDFSKLTAETRSTVINLDFMIPPLTEAEVNVATEDFANMVRNFCGGTVKTYVLSSNAPSFELYPM